MAPTKKSAPPKKSTNAREEQYRLIPMLCGLVWSLVYPDGRREDDIPSLTECTARIADHRRRVEHAKIAKRLRKIEDRKTDDLVRLALKRMEWNPTLLTTIPLTPTSTALTYVTAPSLLEFLLNNPPTNTTPSTNPPTNTSTAVIGPLPSTSENIPSPPLSPLCFPFNNSPSSAPHTPSPPPPAPRTPSPPPPAPRAPSPQLPDLPRRTVKVKDLSRDVEYEVLDVSESSFLFYSPDRTEIYHMLFPPRPFRLAHDNQTHFIKRGKNLYWV